MLSALVPTWYVESIYDLDLDKLWERGIRGIITDLDNTLVAWNAPDPDERLLAWVKGVRERGIAVCIASNNGHLRVEAFAAHLDVPFLAKVRKPLRRGLQAAMDLLGTDATSTVLLGDQIFTDVLGGNRLGLPTVLVRPISQREFFGTRIVRRVERVVLGILRHQGKLLKP
ncbi:MAG: YqeG family HAD IIIA-type phosphatase [Symbiobacteriia bacterium]